MMNLKFCYYEIMIVSIPVIFFLIIWIVGNLRLAKSGRTERIFSYGEEAKWKKIEYAVVIMALLAFQIKVKFHLLVWVFISAMCIASLLIRKNQKIKITEKGIYLNFRYYSWENITELKKKDNGFLSIKGDSRIIGVYGYRTINDIDELILLGNQFMQSNSKQ